MPDGMSTPEKPSIDYLRSLGQPTNLPGATDQLQEAYQEFKPVANATLPDIRMDSRRKDEKDDERSPRDEFERRMAYLTGGGGKMGAVDAIIERAKNIRNLKETPKNVNEASKNEERAEIAKTYVGMAHVFITEIAELNKYLEDLKNPYPYDSRWTMQMANDVLEKVNVAIRERSSLDKEGRVVLRMIKKDCLHLLATARSMEAMGPSYETYFDGELEISQLRTQRTEILAGDHSRMFAAELKGLSHGDVNNPDFDEGKETAAKRDERVKKEKEIITNIFKQLPQRFVEFDFNDVGIENPYREESVEVLDRVGDWGLLMVAAHQKNLEYDFSVDSNGEPINDPEMGENYAIIDETTFRFLNLVLNVGNAPGERYVEDGIDTAGGIVAVPEKELFYINSNGEKTKVGRKLLNAYAMDQTDEKAVLYFKAIFHEIVAKKDLVEVVNKISAEKDQGEQERLLKEQADKLIKRALWRVNHSEALDELGAYDRLIDVLIDTEINLERGTFASGDLGWGWQYSKTEVYNDDGSLTDAGKILKDNYKWLFRIWDLEYRKAELKLDNNPEAADKLFETKFSQLVQEGKYVVIRKKEKGSIYDNHDITTVYYGPDHIMEYDAMADDRSTYFFATIGWYRELREFMPPYWKPELAVFARGDQRLLENFGVDENGDLHVEKGIEKFMHGVDIRKEYDPSYQDRQFRLFDKIDPKAADFINKNTWALVTWVLDEPGKVGSVNRCVPIFMPTKMAEINYWRATSLLVPSGAPKDKVKIDGKEVHLAKQSIWHQRLRHKKYSEFDWDNMPRYRFNYHRVTLDQLERWYGATITPHTYNRATAEQYEEFESNPDGMGMAHKRRGKRSRLGARMAEEGSGVWRAVVQPQMNAMASARESGLYSVGGKNKLIISSLISEIRRKWAGPWVNTFYDMPSSVLKIRNYNDTCAASFVLTWSELELVAESQRIQSIGQVGQTSSATTNMILGLQRRGSVPATPTGGSKTTTEPDLDGAEDEDEPKSNNKPT